MEKRKLTTDDINLICNAIMEKELALLKELGPKHNADFHDRFDALAHSIANSPVDESNVSIVQGDLDHIVKGYTWREAELFRALTMMTRPSADKDRKASAVVMSGGSKPIDPKRLKQEIDFLGGKENDEASPRSYATL